VLALAQQRPDLFSVQQAGDSEEVELVLRAHLPAGAELAAVEEHPVKGRLGVEGLELALHQGVGGLLLAVRLVHERVLRIEEAVAVFLLRAVQGVVALGLHRVGQRHQLRHRGQEDRRRLAALAGTHEAPHRLGEEQRSGGRGGIDADGQPRDVHAFGDHPDGHHPALLAGGEFLDLAGGLGVVGEDDGG
jgi:hypothetical protein